MMTTNQPAPQETQEDINARLALISKAVEEKLLSRQQIVPVEQDVLAVSACPVDPMERLHCESCQ